MSWPFVTAIVAAIFAVGAAVGSKFATSQADHDALALYESNQKITQRRLDAVDAAARLHEQDKARTEELFSEIERMVIDVKQTQFYTDGNLCLDDAGLRAVNAATSPKPRPPASQPPPAVR